jgi:hypothetical protein
MLEQEIMDFIRNKFRERDMVNMHFYGRYNWFSTCNVGVQRGEKGLV